MAPPDAALALRQSVVLSRIDDMRYLRVTGAEAWEALDRLCATDLLLRDGQLRQALLLGSDARPLADCYAGRDDEEYFLLLEGPTGEALTAHLDAHLSGDAVVRDLTGDVRILELHGPYAWELLAAVAGAEAVGLPYLTFFRLGAWTLYRAGKTGEYGYGFVVPAAEAPGLEARIMESGGALDLAVADRAVLDQAALENWFFNIRREGRAGVTPIELQLQWRVSPRKPFVGSEALGWARAAGVARRLTCLVGPGPYAAGDPVRLAGADAGRVVNAGASVVRGDWVALALVDLAWAHPGLPFEVVHDGRASPARSVSPPVLNNRSLHVSPQLHSYATRDATPAPPLERTLP